MLRATALLVITLSSSLALSSCDSAEDPLPEYLGTYSVQLVSPITPPFGAIDAPFLDGVMPDAVSYDIMSGRLWRYVALQRGTLTLAQAGDYTLRLQFDTYEPVEGQDVGPYQSCEGSVSGTYTLQEGALTVSGMDDRAASTTVHFMGPDTLAIDELWHTCRVVINGTVYSSEYYIASPLLVKDTAVE